MELYPDIEESIPLPSSAADAMPELSPKDELDMRARTIKLLSDLSGVPLVPQMKNRDEAEHLARQMMENPKLRPEYAKYPNETLAYLAGLVSQMNTSIVDELSELKLYVVNKLVHEIEHATSSKERISALTALGNIDGVDAFKKRTEMTINVKPIHEVETELLTILENVEYRILPHAAPAAREVVEDCPPSDDQDDLEASAA